MTTEYNNELAMVKIEQLLESMKDVSIGIEYDEFVKDLKIRLHILKDRLANKQGE